MPSAGADWRSSWLATVGSNPQPSRRPFLKPCTDVPHGATERTGQAAGTNKTAEKLTALSKQDRLSALRGQLRKREKGLGPR